MANADTTKTRPPRPVGPEGQGGSGDMKDRTRGVYKPGANPPIPSPIDAVEKWVKAQLAKMKKEKKK